MTIDLYEVTGKGRVSNLAGKDRGKAVRDQFRLDQLDESTEEVIIRVPGDLTAISDSFVLGMFAPSVTRLGGLDAFLRKYRFEGNPEIERYLMRGLGRAAAPRGRLVPPKH